MDASYSINIKKTNYNTKGHSIQKAIRISTSECKLYVTKSTK